MTGYITVNHEMLNAFVERCHAKTLSFHLSTRENLLDHGRISKDEALEMMIDYEIIPTIFGWHCNFYGQECHCRLSTVLQEL